MNRRGLSIVAGSPAVEYPRDRHNNVLPVRAGNVLAPADTLLRLKIAVIAEHHDQLIWYSSSKGSQKISSGQRIPRMTVGIEAELAIPHLNHLGTNRIHFVLACSSTHPRPSSMHPNVPDAPRLPLPRWRASRGEHSWQRSFVVLIISTAVANANSLGESKFDHVGGNLNELCSQTTGDMGPC